MERGWHEEKREREGGRGVGRLEASSEEGCEATGRGGSGELIYVMATLHRRGRLGAGGALLWSIGTWSKGGRKVRGSGFTPRDAEAQGPPFSLGSESGLRGSQGCAA